MHKGNGASSSCRLSLNEQSLIFIIYTHYNHKISNHFQQKQYTFFMSGYRKLPPTFTINSFSYISLIIAKIFVTANIAYFLFIDSKMEWRYDYVCS